MANTTGKKFGGRKKGVKNAISGKVKDNIELFVDTYSGRLDTWIRQAEQENPIECIKLILSAAEFIMPKLARTELTGKDNKALEIIIKKRD